MVDTLVVGATKELVVGQDVLHVGLEELLPACEFFGAAVNLSKVLQVGLEVIRRVKLVVLGGLGRGRGGEEEGGEGEELHLCACVWGGMG